MLNKTVCSASGDKSVTNLGFKPLFACVFSCIYLFYQVPFCILCELSEYLRGYARLCMFMYTYACSCIFMHTCMYASACLVFPPVFSLIRRFSTVDENDMTQRKNGHICGKKIMKRPTESIHILDHVLHPNALLFPSFVLEVLEKTRQVIPIAQTDFLEKDLSKLFRCQFKYEYCY